MPLLTNKASLIKACIANERSAQEYLYRYYFKEMWQLCNRCLPSEALAQEAVNSGFLKVFQHLDSFNEQKGELAAWIKVIMIRTCIDLRRKEFHFHSMQSLDEDDQQAFISPDVLEKLYAEDLLLAIRQLAAATQLVFNLSVIDGYSHKEIAEKLQITESTSRWHLAEARKQLRLLIGGEHNRLPQPTENKRKK